MNRRHPSDLLQTGERILAPAQNDNTAGYPSITIRLDGLTAGKQIAEIALRAVEAGLAEYRRKGRLP